MNYTVKISDLNNISGPLNELRLVAVNNEGRTVSLPVEELISNVSSGALDITYREDDGRMSIVSNKQLDTSSQLGFARCLRARSKRNTGRKTAAVNNSGPNNFIIKGWRIYESTTKKYRPEDSRFLYFRLENQRVEKYFENTYMYFYDVVAVFNDFETRSFSEFVKNTIGCPLGVWTAKNPSVDGKEFAKCFISNGCRSKSLIITEKFLENMKSGSNTGNRIAQVKTRLLWALVYKGKLIPFYANFILYAFDKPSTTLNDVQLSITSRPYR